MTKQGSVVRTTWFPGSLVLPPLLACPGQLLKDRKKGWSPPRFSSESFHGVVRDSRDEFLGLFRPLCLHSHTAWERTLKRDLKYVVAGL
ncbi:hypothetical protein CEXT_550551 [Caerostris extrusa]|uniref:Secreted protein n=1 Tax=Caerostris extrusa TaxID=172846 RepID=A0AAV4SXD2_CAEEX|nr:hypothetical protein CEXT_550551 [Caerostris extrusa]